MNISFITVRVMVELIPGHDRLRMQILAADEHVASRHPVMCRASR
jgi:hypothetical protein